MTLRRLIRFLPWTADTTIDLIDCAFGDIYDQICMFLELTPESRRISVPDPYFCDDSDYARTPDLIEAGTEAWLNYFRKNGQK